MVDDGKKDDKDAKSDSEKKEDAKDKDKEKEKEANDKKMKKKMKEKYKIEESKDFKTLVNKLQAELGQHIIKTINFDDIIKFLSSLIFEIISRTEDYQSEDRLII